LFSDYWQFLDSSLTSISNGFIDVAYSLLRRPLKDDLLILESILANYNDFIYKFSSKNSAELLAIDRLRPEEKILIIEKAVNKIELKTFDAKTIYEFRYSKSNAIGFENKWQPASHLFTLCKGYKTEDGSINIAGPSINDENSDYKYYYSILPNILFYSFQVVTSIYKEIFEKEYNVPEMVIERIIEGITIINNTIYPEYKPYDEFNKNYIFKCKYCSEEVKYKKNIEKQILTSATFKCSNQHINDFFETD